GSLMSQAQHTPTRSPNVGVDTENYADATSHSFAGDTDSTGQLAQITRSSVNVQSGATLETASLNVDASTPNVAFIHSINSHKHDAIDTGDEDDNWRGSAFTTIDFNAHVNVLRAVPNPSLLIESLGNVQQNGLNYHFPVLTPTGHLGYPVDDIDGSGGLGTATFNVSDPTVNEQGYNFTPYLRGTATFDYVTTYDGITVHNASI